MLSFRTLLPLVLLVVLVGRVFAQAPAPASNLVVTDVPNDDGKTLKVAFSKSADDGGGANTVTSYRVTAEKIASFTGAAPTRTADKPATGAASYNVWLTPLRPYIYYTITVVALAGVTESTPISTLARAVDSAVPGPPTNLTATDGDNDNGQRVKVGWWPSPDDKWYFPKVTEYVLQRNTNSGSAGPIIARVPAVQVPTYVYWDETTVRGYTYYYRLYAVAPTGLSTAIGPVACTPKDEMPPRVPSSLSVSDPPNDNGDTMLVTFGRSIDDGSGARDVAWYYVYVAEGTGPFAYVGGVLANGSPTYNYLVTGLTKNVTYQFTVTTWDRFNESAKMTPRSGTPRDTVTPQPPANPIVGNPSGDDDTVLTLRFDRSPDDRFAGDVISYKIYRATVADPGLVEVGSVPAARSAWYLYTVTGLTPNVRYRLGAAAYDGVNTSAIVSAWGDTQPPGPPQNLRVTDHLGDRGTALDVIFDRSADDGIGQNDVTQYILTRRAGTGAWSELTRITASGRNSYSYLMTGLTPGVTYTVQVVANDGTQNSTAISASGVPVDDAPPGAPTNLAVADWPADDGTSLNITFDASAQDTVADPKVTRYDIYRDPTSTGAGAKVGQVTATRAASYQYRDATVTPGLTSWYWALAIAPSGPSAPSNKASGVGLDLRPVQPPSNLTAVDRPYDNGGVIDLTWSRSPDDGAGLNHVAKYFIYRRMATVLTAPVKIGEKAANGSASYAWADTTVPMELILYEYTVTAVTRGAIESTPAGPVRAASENNNVVVFQPPTAFTVKDVAGDTGGQLLLTWTRSTSEGDIGPPPPPPVVFSSDVTTQGGYGGQYEFYRRTASTSYTTTPTFIVSAAGTNNPMTYVDVGLITGTTYYYKVRYRRYNQISNFTAEASAAPIKNQSVTADIGSGDTSGSITAPGTVLSVRLVSPPVSVPAGQDAVLNAAVTAPGAANVALQYSINGWAVAYTPAQSGSGSFSVQLTLPTARLSSGSVIRVRAVAADGAATAMSGVASILIR